LVDPPRRLMDALATMRSFGIRVPLSPQLEPAAWALLEKDWETFSFDVSRATTELQTGGKRLVDATLANGDYQMFNSDRSGGPDKPWQQRDNGEFVVARFFLDAQLQRERVRVVRILPGESAAYDQQLVAKNEALRVRKVRLESYFSK